MASCFPCRSKPAQSVELPDGVERLYAEDEDDAVSAIATAMLGTPETEPEWSIHWIMGREAQTKNGRAQAEWIFRFCYRKALAQDGVVLATRFPSGELSAVCIALFFPKSWSGTCGQLREAFAGVRTSVKLGMPPAWTKPFKKECGPGVQMRCETTLKVLDALHPRVAPGAHCYVNIMAVAPSAQGQGCCGKLMRTVSAHADKLGLPCYLECTGQRNVSIYRKFGYVEQESSEVACPSDPDQSEPLKTLFPMLRPPLASAASAAV